MSLNLNLNCKDDYPLHNNDDMAFNKVITVAWHPGCYTVAVKLFWGVHCWPVVALVAVQAVALWAVNRRLRVLKLRREPQLVKW